MCDSAYTHAWNRTTFWLGLSAGQRLWGLKKLSVSAVARVSDSLTDLPDLRRFGLALARDDRFVLDHAAAIALVERLFRQASFEAVDSSVGSDAMVNGGVDVRVRAFGQFVRLHRRHVRRLTLDDGEAGWDGGEGARGRITPGAGMAAAVRALPLELREALLIVVLANFTHREAASALDISLATLIARLTKARERIAALTHGPDAAETAGAAAPSVPHLRVVK